MVKRKLIISDLHRCVYRSECSLWVDQKLSARCVCVCAASATYSLSISDTLAAQRIVRRLGISDWLAVCASAKYSPPVRQRLIRCMCISELVAACVYVSNVLGVQRVGRCV